MKDQTFIIVIKIQIISKQTIEVLTIVIQIIETILKIQIHFQKQNLIDQILLIIKTIIKIKM